MAKKPFRDLMMKVSVATWRTTICRLIRAEQEAERAINLMNAAVDAGDALVLKNRKLEEAVKTAENFAAISIPASKQVGFEAGQESVLRLIARWGVCRPLEGYNGKQMAEALRKVLTPAIAPYNDYKGITASERFDQTTLNEPIYENGKVVGSRAIFTYTAKPVK